MKSKKMANIILIITTVTTGLIAGLLYAYMCSVNIGLGRLPDKEYLSAMQSINKAIQNPLFFVSFLGTVPLLLLSTWVNYNQPLLPRFYYLAVASVIYLVGVLGVTMLGNVPLNEALAHFDLKSATEHDIVNQRVLFEKPWLLLHNIRTIASIVCLVLVVISLTYPGENN